MFYKLKIILIYKFLFHNENYKVIFRPMSTIRGRLSFTEETIKFRLRQVLN